MNEIEDIEQRVLSYGSLVITPLVNDKGALLEYMFRSNWRMCTRVLLYWHEDALGAYKCIEDRVKISMLSCVQRIESGG